MHITSYRSLKIALGAAALLGLAACFETSGEESGAPAPSGEDPGQTPTTTQSYATLECEKEVSRFLLQAGFGASLDELETLVGTDAGDWIAAEMAKEPTLFLQTIVDRVAAGDELKGQPQTYLAWDALFAADDALRQRMAFALSQIIVVSDNTVSDELRMTYFMDILTRNAFGNYRDLLEEVTYSPAMGEYLTYLKNRKGNPETGSLPDENYARELLQLFTIGLVELNSDGTLRLGSDGNPVETYTNEDIEGLARVFTGLSLAGPNFKKTNQADPDADYKPMVFFSEEHELGPKSFLGITIPEGTTGEQSIDLALDGIFAHPNVPPFVARQIIQRFTASDPSPEYVERVASAFVSGRFLAPSGQVFGDGQRGDLAATLAATLLDSSVHGDPSTQSDGSTKIREPIIKIAQWVRTFDVTDIDSSRSMFRDTSSSSDGLGQHPWRSPSVFNFYRPSYTVPGTLSGDAGIVAPEFQIVNSALSIAFANFATDLVFQENSATDKGEVFLTDYSSWITLGLSPDMLLDALDLQMTAGTLSDQDRALILSALEEIVIEEIDVDDTLRRVQTAILLIMNSSSYGILR